MSSESQRIVEIMKAASRVEGWQYEDVEDESSQEHQGPFATVSIEQERELYMLKACTTRRNKRSSQANADKLAAARKAWRLKNREAIKVKRHAAYLKGKVKQ